MLPLRSAVFSIQNWRPSPFLIRHWLTWPLPSSEMPSIVALFGVKPAKRSSVNDWPVPVVTWSVESGLCDVAKSEFQAASSATRL